MESSDEEYSERLREALDPEFMNDSLFTTKSSTEKTDTKKPPSLRPKRNEDDQFNVLGVTPQFQHYVAKQLSSILDKDLEKRLVSVKTNIVDKKKRKNRVKLFKNSEKCLKLSKEKLPSRPKPKHDSNIDDSKFVEAAVNPADVINQSDVKNWSTKTKGKVFCYRTDTNGTLSLID